MESDKYISVKDSAPDGSAVVVVVDMHAGNAISKKPMKAEATLMNTVENVIALKARQEGQAGHLIQVFNLDTKEKLGVYQIAEQVVFWKWISQRVLALVTDKAVYHWTMSAAAPERMFERAGKLADPTAQIIHYATDKACTWCLLTGISTPDQGRTIEGNMQLYSVERKQQQLLEGHAGNFAEAPVDDSGRPVNLLCFMERKAASPNVTKLHVMDLTKSTSYRVTTDVEIPADAPGDFAIFAHISEKHGVVYVSTKAGYGFVFELGTGALLYRARVSSEPIFIGCGSNKTGGILLVNRKGQVMSFCINESSLVEYIMTLPLMNKQEVAVGLAKRFGYPGCDDLIQQQFGMLFASGDYKGAAVLASRSKQLRNQTTLQQFKSAVAQPGQSSPLLQYFSVLLELPGRLTAPESVELVRPVVAQGRKEFVEKWVKEDKLEPTEEVADLIKNLDIKLALSLYVKAGKHEKVIGCLVEAGQFDQVSAYAKKVGYSGTDYGNILRSLIMSNPEAAVKFAKELIEQNQIELNSVVDSFLSMNKLQETTSVLLDALKHNRPEQAAMQTKLLELNIVRAPQTAEAIFQMNILSHYDRNHIAQLCEKAGMTQRALEHYIELSDIKRCMLNSSSLSPEFLIGFFGKFLANGGSPANGLELLNDLMKYNRQQNLQVVVQIATKYVNSFTADKLIHLFEMYQSYEGMFYFIGGILASNTEANVHFKYIEAATKLNNMSEVERICRDSKYYDAVRVKDFLKSSKLSDPRPLIYVCDQHGFIEELTEYLHNNNLDKFIEVYVIKVNPTSAPKVIGRLIDLDINEDFILNLLNTIKSMCPVGPLVEELEKRNRLRILLPWLEARLAEKSVEPALHNALAKIYVDTNRDPDTFLKTNTYYDSAVVGKYCEDRDPQLSFTAYKRAGGKCDRELVDVTNRNGLFRLQAKYLVERQDPALWEFVLTKSNEYRKNVVDQIVSTALPESKNVDEVSAAVKAFIAADLPNELIELLEKIMFHNTDFSSNRNLQNLLILTAIKADKARVIDYVARLDNYDGPEIAKIAVGEDYQLYEEAFAIYKKCNMNGEAMDVLLYNMCNLQRAAEYASRCDESSVWYKLGKAQLDANLVPEAMDSYLKAEDPRDYVQVIEAASREEFFNELITYLRMARTKIKDPQIDSELLYALAKKGLERAPELDAFLISPHTANVQLVGDRLFEEKLYKAARILYTSIPNNAKIASCSVYLGEFSVAAEAAKKANNPKTWKEVCHASLAAQEYKSAQVAALNLIVHPDHLDDVVQAYERANLSLELMAVLEQGVGNESKAHIGLYTELGIMFARHKPNKLMEFAKTHQGRMNIPKVIRTCETQGLWKETVFLYLAYNENDSAANTMMQHSPSAWTHDEFVAVIKKITNPEIYYKAVTFYLEEHPLQLNSLLQAAASKLDHSRVVMQLRRAGHLGLIQDYLKHVQNTNIISVNEALNELYLETEDLESLRQSITSFDNFDQIGLAQKLEKHELLEMRKLAALLYAKNKRHKQSLELSKGDKNFQDAMQTARDSGNAELAESLLRYFVESGNKECFAACLFTCYELIKPDVALELAWRNGLTDYCMPFMIQLIRDYSGRIETLEKKISSNDENKKSKDEVNFSPQAPLSLPAPPAPTTNFRPTFPNF